MSTLSIALASPGQIFDDKCAHVIPHFPFLFLGINFSLAVFHAALLFCSTSAIFFLPWNYS
jgi:hypothetical protein